jgi:hypothetical protein
VKKPHQEKENKHGAGVVANGGVWDAVTARSLAPHLFEGWWAENVSGL